jgi:hypothetical protein
MPDLSGLGQSMTAQQFEIVARKESNEGPVVLREICEAGSLARACSKAAVLLRSKKADYVEIEYFGGPDDE